MIRALVWTSDHLGIYLSVIALLSFVALMRWLNRKTSAELEAFAREPMSGDWISKQQHESREIFL